jgi:hypothetical protein
MLPARSTLAATIAVAAILAFLLAALGAYPQVPEPTSPYRNPALSVDERVADLLGRMTLEWFALEWEPHPGEKRLLSHLPEPWNSLVRAVTAGAPERLLTHIDTLMDRLDDRLTEEEVSRASARRIACGAFEEREGLRS